ACEPALLLDESCLNQLDYSLGLFDRVKEFSSFDNMRMVLGNEGFNDIDLSDAEKEGDNNVSMVPDSVTEDANVQAEEKGSDLDVNNSLDPFELYPLLNKKRNVGEKMDKSNGTVSIPFPPGFTPCDEREVECDKKSMGNNEGSGFGNEKGESVQGLNPKAKKDWVKEICVSHKVKFLTLQETKMEDISLIDVNCCWGNYTFEYVYSPTVGNSGVILCVWEKSAFKKNNSTISDYFV
nr:RNA-directed DNA polymerase, eukaryota, reverse transcriptase zinc-binding domain protein [Tanacetum cinerariifolium]